MGIEVFGGNDLIMPKLPLCTCAKSNLSLGKEKENLTACQVKMGTEGSWLEKVCVLTWKDLLSFIKTLQGWGC